MKHKQIISLIAGLFLLAALSGCTLAKEEADSAASDRLIGAFITTETLDLFDMDAYLQDHAAQLAAGGELTMTDTAKYKGRIYAAVGDTVTFEGVDGVGFFAPLLTDEAGSYYACEHGEEICDVTLNCGSTDEGESTDLEGTIYALPDSRGDDLVFYVNPVYQTDEGDIYLTGTAGGYMISGNTEGEQIATTLNETTTVTEGSADKTYATTITVHISVAYAPTKITLHQMDSENQIIRSDKFIPGHMPEKLSAEPGAEYILIETEKTSPTGEKSTHRELFEKTESSEEGITTLYPLDRGMLSTQYTEVIWR